VDGLTSQDIICQTGIGNLYDYRFENLCFEAFGGREIGCFPLAKRLDASGFGPLPNSIMYAEVFSRLVKSVNLLDRVRLDLPILFKAREYSYTGERTVDLVELRSTICTTGGLSAAYGDGLGAPPSGTLGSVGAWFDWTAVAASKGAFLTGCPYKIASFRIDVEYRAEIDPDFWSAVPAEVLDLVNLGSTGFLAIRLTDTKRMKRETVDSDDADRCPNEPELAAFWFDDEDNFFRWVSEAAPEVSECVVIKSGVLEAPGLQGSDYNIGRTADMTEGTYCANGPSSGLGLQLIAEQGAFLIVPLS